MAGRADHEMFYDVFYSSHRASLRLSLAILADIEEWVSYQHKILTCSRKVLLKIMNDTKKFRERPGPPPGWGSENTKPMLIEAINDVAAEYNIHTPELNKRLDGMAILSRRVDVCTTIQTEKMHIVKKCLPMFFWKSSEPMKRMLEMAEMLKKLVRSLSHLKTNMDTILSGRRDIEIGIWECRKMIHNHLQNLAIRDNPQPQNNIISVSLDTNEGNDVAMERGEDGAGTGTGTGGAQLPDNCSHESEKQLSQ
ncbi:hypothetical protein DRE_06451 [Drechslerella stenobrocha 248]|uniref:Uncharacterized protein n=1 Tax=Drechslerella stenobrocha 248 TaxID=1043628 RepID=W7HY03_9PEZI|nr:hypothetical protein DRE_06451 [Drechslerella stenobrocha 248]